MQKYLSISLVLLLACSGDKSLTVQNPAPTADILSHESGDEILEGFIINLEGAVSDSNHDPEELVTTWKINGTAVCEGIVPDTDGSTVCEVVFGPDDTEITLEVRDAENKVGEDTVDIMITETEQPVAEIVSPISDGVYYSDQLITFEGLVSDAEDDSELLVAYWESNASGVLSDVDGDVSNSGEVLGYGTLTEGQHAIELHVEDTTGKTSTESVIIDVGPHNSAPDCSIDAPINNDAGPEGGLVTFEGTVSDVDVPASFLLIEWSSDKDGVLGTSSPDSNGIVSFPYSNLTVNSHVISMTVIDEVGAECVSNLTYTVGTPPSITIDTPVDSETYSAGDAISFSATVSDDQDQPDEVSLDWSLDGNSISTQGATSSGTAEFSDSSLAFGAYNLVVTATDTDGLTDSDQINFTINGLPTTPVVSITPGTPTTTDGLNVSIDTPSTDPEGNTVSYTYEWQLGGQVQSTQITSSLSSSATSKGEQWTVVVTPNDGIADGVSGMASVVIGNTAPTVGAVSVTPAGTVYNDELLTCSATVTDPDETPTTTYEWSIGGNAVGTGSTLDLSTSGAMPGDMVVCTVTASDGVDSVSNSGSQSIANRNPSITASISANGPNQNAELTCVGIDTDADQESTTVTYEWFNSSTLLSSSNPLQLSSTLASSGDVIDCVATATDPSGGSASATASHTVINTAPVINSVTVSPDPATIGQDDLTCTVSGSDVDGDALLYSYEWSDSSGVQQTTTLVSGTTNVFLTSGLTEDTWTCEVTPYDGIEYGVAESTTLEVVNGCNSLYFDGVDDFVLIGDETSISALSEVSFGAWIYLESHSGWQSIVGKYDNDSLGEGEYLLQFDSSVIRVVYQTVTGSAYREINHSLATQRWIHLATSYDGVNELGFQLYIDGQQQALGSPSSSISGAMVDSDEALYFGARQDGGTQHFNGNISNVALYDRALSGTEIETMMFSPASVSNLIGEWKLNRGIGVQALDTSGNGLHGIVDGATWSNMCPEEDLDEDGYASWEDCDDNDATIYPFAGDTYGDGVDSDCDGTDLCEADTLNGTYFAACYDPVSWSNAHSSCQSFGYDGLASIIDNSENDFIHNLQPVAVTNNSGLYWIGFTDIQSEGNFEWVSNLSISFTDWNPNSFEPNGGPNENCAHLYNSTAPSTSYGYWNDHSCSTTQSYICEKR